MPDLRLARLQSVTVLSRHPTAEGIVCYVRCVCGSVSIRLEPHNRATVLVLARGDATPPDGSNFGRAATRSSPGSSPGSSPSSDSGSSPGSSSDSGSDSGSGSGSGSG